MFVERLINQGNAPLLERMLRFTTERHRLIAENVVNLSTPGYRQKDLSVDRFQAMLRDRVVAKRTALPGTVDYSDVDFEMKNPSGGILFHDGNNRSVEQLMTDQAKNAMLHNLVVELLRKQFMSMENALKERLG